MYIPIIIISAIFITLSIVIYLIVKECKALYKIRKQNKNIQVIRAIAIPYL